MVHPALTERCLGQLQLLNGQTGLASTLRNRRSYQKSQRVRPGRSFSGQASCIALGAPEGVGIAQCESDTGTIKEHFDSRELKRKKNYSKSWPGRSQAFSRANRVAGVQVNLDPCTQCVSMLQVDKTLTPILEALG